MSTVELIEAFGTLGPVQSIAAALVVVAIIVAISFFLFFLIRYFF